MKLINTLKQVILEVGEDEPTPEKKKKPGLISKIKGFFKKKPMDGPSPIPKMESLKELMNKTVMFTEVEKFGTEKRTSKYQGRIEIVSPNKLIMYNFMLSGMNVPTTFKINWNTKYYFELTVDPKMQNNNLFINSSGYIYPFLDGSRINVKLEDDEYGQDEREIAIYRYNDYS